MTAKRFVVEKYSVRDMSIDEKYVNSSYYIGDKGIAQSLCDLLNELHEEKEQVRNVLKKYLDYYTERAVLLKEPYADVTEVIHDIANELGVDL